MIVRNRSDKTQVNIATIFSDNRVVIYKLITMLQGHSIRFIEDKWLINEICVLKKSNIIVIEHHIINNKIVERLAIFKSLSDLLRVYEIIGI